MNTEEKYVKVKLLYKEEYMQKICIKYYNFPGDYLTYSFFSYSPKTGELCLGEVVGSKESIESNYPIFYYEHKKPYDMNFDDGELIYYKNLNKEYSSIQNDEKRKLKKALEEYNCHKKLKTLEDYIKNEDLDIKKNSKTGKRLEILRCWLYDWIRPSEIKEHIKFCSNDVVYDTINIFKRDSIHEILKNEIAKKWILENPDLAISSRKTPKRLKDEAKIELSYETLRKIKNKSTGVDVTLL